MNNNNDLSVLFKNQREFQQYQKCDTHINSPNEWNFYLGISDLHNQKIWKNVRFAFELFCALYILISLGFFIKQRKHFMISIRSPRFCIVTSLGCFLLVVSSALRRQYFDSIRCIYVLYITTLGLLLIIFGLFGYNINIIKQYDSYRKYMKSSITNFLYKDTSENIIIKLFKTITIYIEKNFYQNLIVFILLITLYCLMTAFFKIDETTIKYDEIGICLFNYEYIPQVTIFIIFNLINFGLVIYRYIKIKTIQISTVLSIFFFGLLCFLGFMLFSKEKSLFCNSYYLTSDSFLILYALVIHTIIITIKVIYSYYSNYRKNQYDYSINGLMDLLNDKYIYNEFMEFCRSDYCIENMMFFKEFWKYKFDYEKQLGSKSILSTTETLNDPQTNKQYASGSIYNKYGTNSIGNINSLDNRTNSALNTNLVGKVRSERKFYYINSLNKSSASRSTFISQDITGNNKNQKRVKSSYIIGQSMNYSENEINKFKINTNKKSLNDIHEDTVNNNTMASPSTLVENDDNLNQNQEQEQNQILNEPLFSSSSTISDSSILDFNINNNKTYVSKRDILNFNNNEEIFCTCNISDVDNSQSNKSSAYTPNFNNIRNTSKQPNYVHTNSVKTIESNSSYKSSSEIESKINQKSVESNININKSNRCKSEHMIKDKLINNTPQINKSEHVNTITDVHVVPINDNPNSTKSSINSMANYKTMCNVNQIDDNIIIASPTNIILDQIKSEVKSEISTTNKTNTFNSSITTTLTSDPNINLDIKKTGHKKNSNKMHKSYIKSIFGLNSTKNEKDDLLNFEEIIFDQNLNKKKLSTSKNAMDKSKFDIFIKNLIPLNNIKDEKAIKCKLQSQAQNIYKNFIHPGSLYELNIKNNTVKDISEILNSKDELISEDLFNKAYTEVIHNLFLNSYQKFIRKEKRNFNNIQINAI